MVAIKREPESRGISRFVHEKLRPGDFVAAGFPRSHFSLVDAPGYCFIAGGIGITPLLPMMEAVKAAGTAMSVIYCGRRRAAMAFADRVETLAGHGALTSRDTGLRADLGAVVESAVKAGHAIFVCGPAAMIAEVENLAADRGAAVHSERFEGGQALRQDDFAFAVQLVKSGRTLTVPADKTLLQVLEENGYHIRRSCKEGNCGTCETKVLSGRIKHRDVLLAAAQREAMDRMMICVSRAASAEEIISLDL